MKELRDKAEKHVFQAEVDRMMKLIINSLYKNKEVGVQFLFTLYSRIGVFLAENFFQIKKFPQIV